MLQKILLYYHTIKHLRWIQIRYQLWYRVRSKWRQITAYKYNFAWPVQDFQRVSMAMSIDNYNTYFGYNEFTFLNLSHRFDSSIDWDFGAYGKLWTYNLNYFEFLNQENNSEFKYEFNELINVFVEDLPTLNNSNEPFPTSLRIINWIKYFVSNKISKDRWNTSLYSQSYILLDNIEYHILGNHLLENGFALTISGIYFQDTALYIKGKKILETELKEQILDDGAHFELSPMYHCLMLYRLLDTVNMLQSNMDIACRIAHGQEEFLCFLKTTASKMCGWLKAMTYEDGTYPHFNDSTDGIAPTSFQLQNYAASLGIKFTKTTLAGSGYRRLKNKKFDIIIKAGEIGASYIPGHAHADSLSFELRIEGKPTIIDTGITSYDEHKIRMYERSTKAHNTVLISDNSSSEVWGKFRLGKRANSIVEKIDFKEIKLRHNGFKPVIHNRFISIDQKILIISDDLLGNGNIFGTHNLYIHHETPIKLLENQKLIILEKFVLSFENALSVNLLPSKVSKGYNSFEESKMIDVKFHGWLKTKFEKIED